MQSARERVWLGLAIIRFKESENAEGNPDVERDMVHGHLELRLCAMHLRSATEPTGHLSRGCMAGQTRNHLGNQAQLRVLVDSGFTGIHFRASATRCSGGELGSDRPRVRMIGRSLPKALITAWAPIAVTQNATVLDYPTSPSSEFRVSPGWHQWMDLSSRFSWNHPR